MKYSIIFSLFAVILFVPFGMNSIFAQETFIINIPTGAAAPDAPYFWQTEKGGATDGTVDVKILDIVRWENADTAAHTVTSGVSPGLGGDGADGIFDSSLFGPGKGFQYQFTEVGDYEYFCLVHPWMTGIVTVTSGLQVIPNVGSDAGDGTTTYNVEYEFNRVISSARVDEELNSITFDIVGKVTSEDHTLMLMLPKNLISGPLVIWADGQQITNFELTEEGGINKVIIPLNRDTELVSLVGTAVVPEFGAITMSIFALGVLSFLVISFKKQKFMMLYGRK
jgi:hypothetical protein